MRLPLLRGKLPKEGASCYAASHHEERSEIRLVHVEKRTTDATKAAEVLRNLGAEVILQELGEDTSYPPAAVGKLFYYGEDLTDCAVKIASSISDIEPVDPFNEGPVPNVEQHFTLWIVR